MQPLNFENDHWDWLVDHESLIKDHESCTEDFLSVLDIISGTNVTSTTEETNHV